ncbi:hypothetical protein [Bacillus sp. Au-Bac7]|uniref:hypothetical protein n=1 Tax=Bacillus sp. Au-Bac7 TaxID=2906458 RepID=UPI001E50F75A|nr:hypothetical protein [Bacillus sp. Au-Bac7]MCE4048975.1 hypothetical protein [Bacillus sp. Au-Bac7]
MDLSCIYNLIETEFKVIHRESDSICIAPISGESYPETTIKLTFNKVSNHYELYEVVRGKEYSVGAFSDQYNSVLALYIFSKSKFEVTKYDENVQNEIEGADSLNNVQKIFKIQLDEKYYSLLEIKPNRVILEKGVNDRYNVLFLGKNDSKIYIEESRKLNSAAVVLYHFSFKLGRFYELIDKMDMKTDYNFLETLKELYLIG